MDETRALRQKIDLPREHWVIGIVPIVYIINGKSLPSPTALREWSLITGRGGYTTGGGGT